MSLFFTIFECPPPPKTKIGMNFRLFAVSIFVLLLMAIPERSVAQELDVVDIGAVFNETIPLNLS